MKRIRSYQQNAFTIIELLVTVLALGAILAISLPQYLKTLERARERDVVINLRALAMICENYKSATGSYYDTSDNEMDVSWINSTFKLNIIPQKDFLYYYKSAGGASFLAEAISPNGWKIGIDSSGAFCMQGTCPVCDNLECPY